MSGNFWFAPGVPTPQFYRQGLLLKCGILVGNADYRNTGFQGSVTPLTDPFSNASAIGKIAGGSLKSEVEAFWGFCDILAVAAFWKEQLTVAYLRYPETFRVFIDVALNPSIHLITFLVLLI